jgi:hypothetical protein
MQVWHSGHYVLTIGFPGQWAIHPYNGQMRAKNTQNKRGGEGEPQMPAFDEVRRGGVLYDSESRGVKTSILRVERIEKERER